MYNKFKNLILNHSDKNFNNFLEKNKFHFNCLKIFKFTDFLLNIFFISLFMLFMFDFKSTIFYILIFCSFIFPYYFFRKNCIDRFNKKIKMFFNTEVNNSFDLTRKDVLKLELNRFIKKGVVNKNSITDFNNLVLNSKLSNKEKSELIKMIEEFSKEEKILKNIYSFNSSLDTIIKEKEKEEDNINICLNIDEFASLENLKNKEINYNKSDTK